MKQFFQKVGLLILFIASDFSGYAQIGGDYGFSFLQVPTTARVSALSGVNISSQDKDVNMFLANPGLLNSSVSKHVSLNYLDYLADIQYSSIAYAHDHEKFGLWGIGLQYLDYGDFEGFDGAGNQANDFTARDFALTLSHSRTMGVFTLGANVKFAQSYIDSYSATAVFVDIGGVYKHPDMNFTVGMVIKNFGVVVEDYTPESRSNLPFDVQIGTTFKPQYMPFRFSVTAYKLTRGDIAYFDSGQQSNKEAPGFVDKVFRHITLGTEVLLSPNFNLRLGYNHLVRKELRLEETSGGAGFSAGFMVRIKAFELAYARRFYHVAGGSNNITLASNLGSLVKKSD